MIDDKAIEDKFAEISAQLDEKIPRDVVSLRDGGGGRKLSYLEGHYVIDRLNKVFGHLNWAKEITDVRLVSNVTNRGEFPAYLVKVRLTVFVMNRAMVKEGYGYGSDKSSQNAHELAIKEAVTDALKVAAKDLGMSMGLALYDKTQENVEDDKPKAAEVTKPVEVKAKSSDKESLVASVKKAAEVLDKLRRKSIQDFKNQLTNEYGVEKVAELDVKQLSKLNAELMALITNK